MDIKNRILSHSSKPANEFKFNQLNWRKHPKRQIAALKSILRDVGWVQNVIVNERTGNLIDGHARVELALKSGESVPYISVDLSEDEENLILATLDPISAMAGIESEKLGELLKGISVNDAEINLVLDSLAEDAGIAFDESKEIDAVPKIEKIDELRAEWKVEQGQVWKLGAHRLICGDCTDKSIVRKLMNGERAALFSTDPPYLVGYSGSDRPCGGKNWSDEYGKKWDEKDKDFVLFHKFISVAVDEAIADNAAWYHWHASKNVCKLEDAWGKNGAVVHQTIIWVKKNPVLTYSFYLWQHEPCLMGWIRGKKPKRSKNKILRSVWFEEGDFESEIVKIKVDESIYDVDEKMEDTEIMGDVWKVAHPSNASKNLHPTMKPVQIFEIPMKQHTVKNEICFEPFSGSGTQIIAAERMNRRCYAVEINEGFVAVALQRYQDATGIIPVIE